MIMDTVFMTVNLDALNVKLATAPTVLSVWKDIL